MNFYRYVALFSILIISEVFQTTFFSRLGLPGSTPDLVIVVVAVWALIKGPAVGAVAGFIAGFLIDVVPPGNHLMGISSISLGIIGYLIGLVAVGQGRSFFRPLIISSVVATTFFLVRTIWAVIGGSDLELNAFSINFLTQGLYAAVLTIFVYPGIAFLDRKLGPVSRADELRSKF